MKSFFLGTILQSAKRMLTEMLQNVNCLGNDTRYNLGLSLGNKDKWSLYGPP